MARILRKTDKLHLEAQAYLLGILDYFSKGRPVIRPFFPRQDTVYYPRPLLEATLVTGDGNSPIDDSSIYLRLDGKRVNPNQFHFDGKIFRYLPSAPLGSGHHNFELRVRNLKGNSAIPLHFSLVVILPAATIDLKVRPEVILSGGRSLAMIEALVRDETGSPVVDGKNVEFRISGPAEGVWIEQTSAGRASLLYEAKRSGRFSIKADCDGIGDETALSAGRGSHSQAIIILKDRKTDEPITNARVTLEGDEKSYISSTSPEGYVIFTTSLDGSYALTTRKRGYQAYTEMVEMRRGEVTRIDLGLNPVQDGVLTGKVVVIDADHFRNSDPMVQGYRLSDLNLMVANRFRDLIETSGSEVVMVREGDVPLSPVHRVVKSDSGGADVHFILRHSPTTKGKGVQISHYPGSLSGERLAGLLREEVEYFIGGSVGLKEEASTVLRHTSSPTVAVNARIGMKNGKRGISIDRFVLLETNAIYNSLLRYFGVLEDDRTFLNGLVIDRTGQPVEDALVIVDESLTLRTDGKGEFQFRLLDKGFHSLRTVAEGFLANDHGLFIGIEGSENVQIVLEREVAE
jgi:N-acetylmuramoyl-L-alanine amidase